MRELLFYGLSFSYGYNIFINFFRLFQIRKGIYKLSRFINSYESRRNYQKERQNLLSYFPIITRYLGVYSKNLSYGDDNSQTYYKAVQMLDELLRRRDFQKCSLKEAFYPVCGFKAFVTFPMTVFSWFGIRPRRFSAYILGAFGWFVSFMLYMFQPEIKALLIQLFEYLVQAQKP